MSGPMPEKERAAKFSERLEEEKGNPEACIWMSFCDTEKSPGSQFLGVIITKAHGIAHAIEKTWTLEINPGGEVRSYETDASDIASAHFDRLLSKEDLVKCGYCD